MTHIRYFLGCTVCLDGPRRDYVLELTEPLMAEKVETLTFYELSETIESLRIKKSQQCPKCGFSNQGVVDLEINDRSVYSYPKLVANWKDNRNPFYEISMIKTEINISVTYRGVEQMPASYKVDVLQLLLSRIKEKKPEEFNSIIKGTFFGSVSGPASNLRIEKLRCNGLSKQELVLTIENELAPLNDQENEECSFPF